MMTLLPFLTIGMLALIRPSTEDGPLAWVGWVLLFILVATLTIAVMVT